MLPEKAHKNEAPAPALKRAIGLMSGTSLDGVDAALIETDGRYNTRTLGFITTPYPEEFRDRMRAVFGRTDDPDGVIAQLARDLTDYHVAAILALLAQTGYEAGEIDVIGFHGQTITHLPQQKFTWQIGDPDHLAQTLDRPVVFNFRTDDVAAGGQGAPLLPVYHQALVARAALDLPVALLNIGGVANITYLGAADGELIAFDTGPGNAMIDDVMAKRTGRPFDADGALAKTGTVDRDLLNRWLARPYFQAPPPKSLDRNDFDVRRDVDALGITDAIATLTAFTVASAAAAFDHLPTRPQRLLVTGGGRHNATIMAGLSDALRIPVESVDQYNFNGDSMEAEGFAYMAVRRLDGLPISFPGTTGAPKPMTGGVIVTPQP